MENNELFAEFLEWKKNEDGTFESPSKFFWEDKHAHMSWNVVRYDWKPSNMLFDVDWNWLMEVVEKIENQYRSKFSKNTFPCVSISSICCKISFYGNYEEVITNIIRPTKIEAVYQACLEFIKWYNENKSK